MRPIPVFLCLALAGCATTAKSMQKAIHAGDVKALGELIDKGAPVDTIVAKRRKELVMRSLRYETPYSYEQTALHNAVSADKPEVLKLLIRRGADVNGKDPFGRTPLADAIIWEHRDDLVWILLDAGASIDAAIEGLNRRIERFSGSDKSDQFWVDEYQKAVVRLNELRTEQVERAQRQAAGERERQARQAAKAELEKAIAAIRAEEEAGDAAAKAGKKMAALERYSAALQAAPAGAAAAGPIREKAVRLALSLNALPETPQEARRMSARAQAMMEMATRPEDHRKAAETLERALALAPWWAQGYRELGMAREHAQDYQAAVDALNLYLQAAPGAADAEAVQTKVYKLEALRDMQR